MPDAPFTQSALRLRHKITAHHWRHNRRHSTSIGICSCGWRCSMFRRAQWATRWRKVYRLCWLRGHAYDEPTEVHAGPVGFDESEDTLLGSFRQCDRCYETRRAA